MARSLHERLKYDLAQNRADLFKTVSDITDLTYAPGQGMKDFRAQLVEIGAMDAESIQFLTTGQVSPFEEIEKSIKGSTLQELLESLSQIRSDLIDVLDSLSESQLHEAVLVPEDWVEFVGDSTLEREELFRWLIRHEYYHLGQIITYRWIQGFSPY